MVRDRGEALVARCSGVVRDRGDALISAVGGMVRDRGEALVSAVLRLPGPGDQGRRVGHGPGLA
jgi:hypothetical protein